MEDGQFNGYKGMMAEQFYFTDWSCLGNSVSRYESGTRKAAWDVGRHFRNHGNLWCVAFALGTALKRMIATSRRVRTTDGEFLRKPP